MRHKKKIIPSIILFAVVCLFGSSLSEANAQKSNEQLLMERAEDISGDVFEISTTTPKGVLVYAVKNPNSATLNAIDEGFTNLFAIARRHGYKKRLNYSDYTVFIARADRTKDSSGNYSPDVAVPVGQYAGSVYDKGGFLYAAGMVLAFNPSAFVIAEHEKNFERVSDVVRFECEHIVLYYNDRKLYKKTADHSKGGGHPILK